MPTPIFNGFSDNESLIIATCKHHFNEIFRSKRDEYIFLYRKLYGISLEDIESIDWRGAYEMFFELWLKFYKNNLLYGQSDNCLNELVLECPIMDWFRPPKSFTKEEYLFAKCTKMASAIANTVVFEKYEFKQFSQDDVKTDKYYRFTYEGL